MSVISGIIGAQEQAGAARATTRQTNVSNLALALMARGAPIQFDRRGRPVIPQSVGGAQSAILPYYFGDREASLAGNAGDIFDAVQAANGSPSGQISDLSRVLSKYDPAFDANDRFVIDLASGDVTKQMLDESQPVFDARIQAAQSKKNAGLEALESTLNEIDAIQAKKGYTGDSFGNRLLKFNARRSVASQGSDDLNQAMLENALEKRATLSQGRQMQLSGIGLPDTLARASLSRRTLPTSTVSDQFAASMRPFQFFNIGPHEFAPWQTPDTGANAWQMLSQAGSTIGGAALNYGFNRNLQNNAYANASNLARQYNVANGLGYSSPAAAQAGLNSIGSPLIDGGIGAGAEAETLHA